MNLSKVIDSSNYDITESGVVTDLTTGRFLNHYNGPKGYQHIHLYCKGRKVTRTVHRLVYESFKGIPDGIYINHIDGNKRNNNLSNLVAVKPRSVIQFSSFGVEIKRYVSIREAYKHTGVLTKAIRNACLGYNKLAGGYKWMYE